MKVYNPVFVDDFAERAKNDRDLIQMAIAEAKGANASHVFFSPRKYYVGGFMGENDIAHLVLDGMSDIIFDGTGATLVCREIKPGILINNCQNITLRGFVIDWDVLLASLGVIETLNGEKHLRILPECNTEGAPVRSVCEFDFDNRTWKMNTQEFYMFAPGFKPDDNYEQVEKGLYKFQNKNLLNMFKDGDKMLVRHYVYEGTAAVYANGRKNESISLERLTVLQCPSHAYLFTHCGKGICLDGCRIARGDQSRPITATADGVHIGSCRGDIVIENCDFSLQGDDSVNIHGRWTRANSLDERKINVRSADLKDFTEVGDPVNFHSATNLEFYGTAIIAEIEKSASEDLIILTIDREIPEGFAAGDLIANQNNASDNFIIRNNYFHDHRARGMLIQAKNGIIEENLIVNVQGAGIQITTDCDFWLEGFGCENVVVRGNRLIGVNKVNSSSYRMDRHPAALNVVVDTPTGIGDYPLHKNIIIENNEIVDTPGAAMLVASVENATIRGNRIKNSGYNPNQELGKPFGHCFDVGINIIEVKKGGVLCS